MMKTTRQQRLRLRQLPTQNNNNNVPKTAGDEGGEGDQSKDSSGKDHTRNGGVDDGDYNGVGVVTA